MTHTITENRLNKIIIKYLNNKFENVEQLRGVYYDIVFKLPNEKYGTLGWDNPSKLSIHESLINEISNLFGMDELDSMEVISKYIENTYDLKVIHTDYIILDTSPVIENTYDLKVIHTVVGYKSSNYKY